MRRFLTALTLSATLFSLGGCVLAVGNGDMGDDSGWSSSDYRNSDLAHAVRSALEADPATREADLTVAADHGRVYLSGEVHGQETLARAVELALATADVKSVRCRVTVIR